MGDGVNMKEVVQSLLDGSLAEKLCRVCLMPLADDGESVFARVCEDGREYSVADCLAAVCNLQLSDSDDYSVCFDCFTNSTSAFKFHLQCKNTNTILDLYINEINSRLLVLETNQSDIGESVCITLPKFELTGQEVICNDIEFTTNENDLQNYTANDNNDMESEETNDNNINIGVNEKDKTLIVVSYENGKEKVFQHDIGGNLVELPDEAQASDSDSDEPVTMNKDGTARKKRSLMEYRSCSQCPIKYRFISKLKEHMKTDHGIDLHICKLCQYSTESEGAYHTHLQQHNPGYTCAVCGSCFKRRSTLEAHVKRHSPHAHTCATCGRAAGSAAALRAHVQRDHAVSHTCYYCGKMYKGVLSFERHIKRHEELMGKDGSHQCSVCPSTFPTALLLSAHTSAAHPAHPGDPAGAVACRKCDATFSSAEALRRHARTHRKGFRCETCGRDFVDARALMWHRRLHAGERPYECEHCGRAFVTVNRRNQHALCAHSAPARRCPLCPAAFHLASMVNAHIKKVHLKQHKRHQRSRAAAAAAAAAPVALQDLSLRLQDRVLELQSRGLV